MINEQDMSDEEKSFHEWINNNLQFVGQNKHLIHLMKKIYIDGFVSGYSYSKQIFN